MALEPILTGYEIDEQACITPASPAHFTALALFQKDYAEILTMDHDPYAQSSLSDAFLGLTESGEPCAVVATRGILDRHFRLYKGLIAAVGIFHNIYNNEEFKAFVFDEEARSWKQADDKNVLIPLLGMTQALYKGLTVAHPAMFLEYVRGRNLGKDRKALANEIKGRMGEETVTSQDLIGILLYLMARGY